MKKLLITPFWAAAASLAPAVAWAQDTAVPERYVYYPHMMGWGDGWSGMVFGPLFFLIMVGLVVALVVVLFRRAEGPPRGGAQRQGPTPLDVLKERFARGEIDQQEYESRRRVLSE